ncbi:MAG: hypothetical protein ABEL76_05640 [Bradymonadaceae bacterium]
MTPTMRPPAGSRLQTLVAPVLLAVWIGLIGGAASCRTPDPPPDRVDLEEMSQSRLLYEATVETFRERGLTIDAASAKHRIVTTTYRPVRDGLRRRFVAQIVPVRGGASGLRVRAEYQRRQRDESGEPRWRTVEDGEFAERAEERELELGRAIEERYNRWKRAARAR